MEKHLGKDLGRRIAAARAYREMSQAKLATDLHMDPSTLGRYEKGQIPYLDRQRPGLEKEVAEALELPIEFFEIEFSELPAMRWARDQLVVRAQLGELEKDFEAEVLRYVTNGSRNEGSDPAALSQ